MNKPKKDQFEDDGRSIANMDLEGTRWARKGESSRRRDGKKNEFEELNLTRKERRAIFWGAMGAILPVAIAFIVLYFLAFFILDLIWLK